MDGAVDHLSSVLSSSPLVPWVLGSVLVYALATNVLWLIQSREIWHSSRSRWLVEAGRLMFYLGIPYLALGGWPRQPYGGLLSPEDMGLVGLNERWPVTRWLEAAGTGLGLGLVTLLILVVAWANANRDAEGTQLRFAPRPWWGLVVDVLYLEVHWAFYRGAVAVAFDDVYAGAFLGLGLVYAEWGLSPYWRRGWRQSEQAGYLWLRTALALAVALIFVLTRNLWICLVVHLLLESASVLASGAPAESPGREPTQDGEAAPADGL